MFVCPRLSKRRLGVPAAPPVEPPAEPTEEGEEEDEQEEPATSVVVPPEDPPVEPTLNDQKIPDSYEPPRKRSRNELVHNLELVASAVELAPGRSRACLNALRGMTLHSLGPKHDLRDDLQNKAAAIVGRVLREVEMDIQSHAGPDLRLSLRSQEADLEAKLRHAMMVQDSRASRLAELQASLEPLRRAQQDATATRSRADAAVLSARQESQRYNDAYNQHCLLLKDGAMAGRSPSDAQRHVDALLPLLRELDIEEALLAGLAAAATSCDQAGWCTRTLLEVESRVQAQIEQSEAKATAAEADAARARSWLFEAEEALRLAESSYDLEASVNGSSIADIRAELHEVQSSLRTIELETHPKEAEIQRFRDGPLAAYYWLLTHNETCESTWLTTQDLMLNRDVQAKVTSVINCLRYAPGRSSDCKDMLVSIVAGCLGPEPSERDDVQNDGSTMISTALSMEEDDCLRAIANLLPGLGATRHITTALTQLTTANHPIPVLGGTGRCVACSHELELDAKFCRKCGEPRARTAVAVDAGDPTSVAEAIFAEKMAALESYDSSMATQRETMEQAWHARLAIEGRLASATKALQSLQDKYSRYFAPLIEGRGSFSESCEHILEVQHLLHGAGDETCLVGPFSKAAAKPVSSRGSWDHALMEEVDRRLKDYIAEADSEKSACERELLYLRPATDIVSSDRRQVLSNELDVAKQIKEKVAHLVNHRTHCLDAFRWLQLRRDSLRSSGSSDWLEMLHRNRDGVISRSEWYSSGLTIS